MSGLVWTFGDFMLATVAGVVEACFLAVAVVVVAGRVADWWHRRRVRRDRERHLVDSRTHEAIRERRRPWRHNCPPPCADHVPNAVCVRCCCQRCRVVPCECPTPARTP